MDELNLVIKSPEEAQYIDRIVWNREEFETAIQAAVADYKGVVYTEDTIKQAKEDRAKLNKLSKAIDARRIEVKNRVMAPYSAFEKEVAEVKKQLDDTVRFIDDQVKAYQEEQKAKKLEEIRRFYEEKAEGLDRYIRFDDIFNRSWLNATYAMKNIQAEIIEKTGKVRSDLEQIAALEGEEYAVAIGMYNQTHDLAKAMQSVVEYGKAKAQKEAEKNLHENENENVDEAEIKVNNIDQRSEVDRTEQPNDTDDVAEAEEADEVPVRAELHISSFVAKVSMAELSSMCSQIRALRLEAWVETKAHIIGIDPVDMIANVRIRGTVDAIRALAMWMKTQGMTFGRPEGKPA